MYKSEHREIRDDKEGELKIVVTSENLEVASGNSLETIATLKAQPLSVLLAYLNSPSVSPDTLGFILKYIDFTKLTVSIQEKILARIRELFGEVIVIETSLVWTSKEVDLYNPCELAEMYFSKLDTLGNIYVNPNSEIVQYYEVYGGQSSLRAIPASLTELSDIVHIKTSGKICVVVSKPVLSKSGVLLIPGVIYYLEMPQRTSIEIHRASMLHYISNNIDSIKERLECAFKNKRSEEYLAIQDFLVEISNMFEELKEPINLLLNDKLEINSFMAILEDFGNEQLKGLEIFKADNAEYIQFDLDQISLIPGRKLTAVGETKRELFDIIAEITILKISNYEF